MRIMTGVVAILALGALTACPGKGQGGGGTATGTSKAAQGTPLAKVGSTVITVESFEEKLNNQSPFIRSRYADLEKRREYLDNQIRFELLAAEAERRGMLQDPEVQESLKKIMVQRLTREEFDNRVKLEDITDAEIEAFYNEHLEDYHKPEMVRVAHIFIPFGADKAAAMKSAKSALREVRQRKDDRLSFRDLAKQYSQDEETKNVGGDLRYMSKDEYAEQLGAAASEAVFALEKLNDLSDVVEGKAGFHIFKQTGRRQAIERTLAQVRTQIRNRLYRDKRTASFDAFVDNLRQKAGVTVDEAKLAAITIATTPQPAAPQMPGPSPVPAENAPEVAEGANVPAQP